MNNATVDNECEVPKESSIFQCGRVLAKGPNAVTHYGLVFAKPHYDVTKLKVSHAQRWCCVIGPNAEAAQSMLRILADIAKEHVNGTEKEWAVVERATNDNRWWLVRDVNGVPLKSSGELISDQYGFPGYQQPEAALLA